jgi:signal transduction histidine kinase
MDIYSEIIKKFPLLLIIWNIYDDIPTCYNINQKKHYLKKGVILDDYINNNNIYYKNKYYELILTKNKQIINMLDKIIIMEYVNDNYFYEIHYEKYDHLNILSTISHKIRNPLTNIIGLLSYNNNYELNKVKEHMSIIKHSSYEIMLVLNDVIDIINFEKNKISIKLSLFNIENIIMKCCNIANDDLKQKNLIVNININEDVPEIIMIDESRLQQLIMNILKNAINYTDSGSITISVLLMTPKYIEECPFKFNKSTNKYNLLFKIKDTGCGIIKNKNYVNKILGLKYNENNIHNYGMGLLISKFICNLFDGNIWYKSTKDIGTIFYFNILCNAK